ncbi:uncharacterized protein LACBIDRAFT_298489 [Laccaria bicolor S238N-H82]|uniref:Predicted protein n=1 Tax=Laccaria bicolor (strain S238N-H82 / ATCC MYA-4686) TaxID=486041 RepID=B0DCZ3_LACBS|nr:uncharacterized protein LACBIDRAFT_298489 [Laccaria bicolor S238N-H82]EDR07522.1 predicted protein [Laccaria bicolor S238N-H82]|eukprot:XP_001881914.1 predicted protein [Laccaria bicolor S238N-H82]
MVSWRRKSQSPSTPNVLQSAIMAGSGIRGQFEEKFKALLRDMEDEGQKVISSCFIDAVRECHYIRE